MATATTVPRYHVADRRSGSIVPRLASRSEVILQKRERSYQRPRFKNLTYRRSNAPLAQAPPPPMRKTEKQAQQGRGPEMEKRLPRTPPCSTASSGMGSVTKANSRASDHGSSIKSHESSIQSNLAWQRPFPPRKLTPEQSCMAAPHRATKAPLGAILHGSSPQSHESSTQSNLAWQRPSSPRKLNPEQSCMAAPDSSTKAPPRAILHGSSTQSHESSLQSNRPRQLSSRLVRFLLRPTTYVDDTTLARQPQGTHPGVRPQVTSTTSHQKRQRQVTFDRVDWRKNRAFRRATPRQLDDSSSQSRSSTDEESDDDDSIATAPTVLHQLPFLWGDAAPASAVYTKHWPPPDAPLTLAVRERHAVVAFWRVPVH